MADTTETKKVTAAGNKAELPTLSPGDTVKVSVRIKEGEKERVQLYQGVVIKVREGADGGNFTVRRVAYGVGVERTFPSASPMIAKVELVRHGKVRRARLFYLRDLSGKAARIKEKRFSKEKLALMKAAAQPGTETQPES
jgi:large subunit ribosomal protein L19